jgi:hypothetical protein
MKLRTTCRLAQGDPILGQSGSRDGPGEVAANAALERFHAVSQNSCHTLNSYSQSNLKSLHREDQRIYSKTLSIKLKLSRI